jgi:hypothetical protein
LKELSWREDLMRYLLLATLGFLSVCSFVGVVFADPLPWDSLWEGKPIQYFSIIAAEFYGLLLGAVILTQYHQIRWQKATITMSIALIISYVIGITIWTLGYQAGILIYNPVNPFFNASTHPLGTTILLLPEFIGIIIGTIIIHANQKVEWKTAFITMTAAMLTSLLVGILIANIYLGLM